MVHSAGAYARRALDQLTEYCEFMEEENVRLAEENEMLKSNFFTLPIEMIKEQSRHTTDKGHNRFNYFFERIDDRTVQVACDCYDCTWHYQVDRRTNEGAQL